MERSRQQLNKSNGRTRPKKLYNDSDDETLDLKIDSIREKSRTPCFVYVLTFFSSLGGFLIGYDTYIMAGAMNWLKTEFSLTYLWQEVIVAVTLGVAAVFALIGGILNDRLGRRSVVLCACIVFTAAAILMGIANGKYMLLSGRILAGISVGLMSTTVPMYIAECSPIDIRGRLVSCNIVMVACGQFVAGVTGGMFAGDERNGWRYMLGLSGIPSFIQFMGFIFMPESPRWLIVSRQEEKARRVLQSIRGQLDIDEEYENIKLNYLETQHEHETNPFRSKMPVLCQMISNPLLRRSLAVGCLLHIVQQIAGINTIMYYSTTIVKMSGVRNTDIIIWFSTLTAAVNFIFTLLSLYLVEKIGRRLLILSSLIGTIISLVLIAIGFHVTSLNTPKITIKENLQNSSCVTYSTCHDCMMNTGCGMCFMNDGYTGIANTSCLPGSQQTPMIASSGRCNANLLPDKLSWAFDYCPSAFSWMPLVGLILYIVTFSPGIGPMPWTINSEIYPTWTRSTAISLSTFINWTFYLASYLSFIPFTESLSKVGTFLLYAGLTLVGALLLLIWLPESKGRSLEEVEGLFANQWCGVGAKTDFNTKTIQYVHIRGLNRDGRDSELESPE